MTDEPKPPTDEQLAEMEISLLWEDAEAGDDERPHVSARLALRLMAEVRRLRSDEWLERAAAEYGRAMGWQFDAPREELLAVLRKHRDGKA